VLPAASTITAAIPDANDPRAVRHKPAAAAARPKQRSGIANKIQQWGRYICCQVRRWRLGQGLSRSAAPPGCPAVRCRAIWRRRPARCRTRRTDPSTPTRSCRPPPVQVITAITDARAGLASFARARMDSSSSSGPGQGMDRTAGSRRRS
jgi:hypothetical protein